MYIVGVDPGFNGAIVVLDKDNVGLPKFITAFKMPFNVIKKSGKKRKEFDIPGTFGIYSAIRSKINDEKKTTEVHLEKSNARPDNGCIGNFTSGESFMMHKAILTCLGMKFETIHPRKWKSKYGLIKKEKTESIKVVQKLYPKWNPANYSPKDYRIGVADAILIALYEG